MSGASTATQSIKDITPPKRLGIAGNIVVLQYREGFAACDGDAQRSFTGIATLE